MDTDMQYLYNDGEEWHFMEPKSYEQFAVSKEAMGEAAQWLKGQEDCVVTLLGWNAVICNGAKFC